MANGIYKITEDFEKALSDYTGAPYVITVDNQSNALFLALYYEKNVKKSIESEFIGIPARTYPSVPCEIIHAGLKVQFEEVEGKTLKGAYQLKGSNVWDSALRFTADMYIPESHMCISFTGPYKHFKLSKGGAILTDDHIACFSSLIGKGEIVLEDFSGLSSRVSLYSSSDDYSGSSLTNPTIDSSFTNVLSSPVIIKKHVIVGAGAVILPGVIAGEGSAIGSLSLISKNIPAWEIWGGSPAKKIKERKKDLLEIEWKFLAK
jgi:acetyltransferase-like isoleucine patch superfamily enzyme